jgi:hypothetical protein
LFQLVPLKTHKSPEEFSIIPSPPEGGYQENSVSLSVKVVDPIPVVTFSTLPTIVRPSPIVP